jgi:formate hydrogenlyase subunit 6/NADH:ubiquinone oxidoreductase subunit I
MPRILAAPRMARCIGCDSCMLACARMIYQSFSPHKSAIQIRSRGGVMGRLVANICTACAEPVPCVEVCPTEALTVRTASRSEAEQAVARGMTYRKAECIGCYKCVEACPIQVIGWDQEENKPIVCIFCGQCVRFCPHDCLEMVAA